MIPVHPYTFLQVALFCLLLTTACRITPEHNGEDVLAKAGELTLTRAQLAQEIPVGISGLDSVRFAQAYISNWAREAIFYDGAHLHVSETYQIDQEVEAYRRRLIVQRYEKEQWEKQLGATISDSALHHYYLLHSSDYLLQEPLLKGLLFKIPVKDRQLPQIKRWLRKNDIASQQKLLSYLNHGGYAYTDYTQKWVSVKEAVRNFPANVGPYDRFVRDFQFFEANKGTYCYYLTVQSYLCTGAVIPFEMARDQVRDAYLFHQQKEFIQGLENQLYQEALQQHKIVFYDKEQQALL